MIQLNMKIECNKPFAIIASSILKSLNQADMCYITVCLRRRL